MKYLFYIASFLVGCAIFVWIVSKSIPDYQIPSLSEFIASSTGPMASSSADIMKLIASSTILSSDNEASSSVDGGSPSIATTSAVSTSTAITGSVVDLYAPIGVIHAEIADTDASREQGLSGRHSLAQDQGMLFIFDTSGQYGFWMKDMEFSLDMVWMNENKTIVGVTKDISTSTYPSTFDPPVPVKYVLEIKAGSADALGLVPGVTVGFDPFSK
jgi:uncharacterized membrane protein (UPF0127 family)